MSDRFALKARYVFPATAPPIADGVVVVEGDRIVSVDGGEQETIDLGNVAILPGLVNAHAHLDFNDLDAPLGHRGIGLVDWIRLVLEYRQSVECVKRTMPDYGATTIGDIVQQCVGCVKRTMLDADCDNNHGAFHAPYDSSPPRIIRFLELKAVTADQTAEAVAQAKSHIQGDNAGLSPHAPYTVHPELLDAIVKLSVAEHVPVSMHLAESPEELEFLRDGTGPFRTLLEDLGRVGPDCTTTNHFARPMDYLRRLASADRALVIHGNYLDDEEIAFLGANAARMSVVYCPRSHDWFGHAEYPLEKMLEAGATVALGTDGLGSTPDLSLLEEMRSVARRHPNIGLERIILLGTLAGAKALGLDGEIGSLTVGKRADMTIVALPDREAADPHELLFDSTAPVVGCCCGGTLVKPRPLVAPSVSATSGRGFMDCWFLTGPTASGKSAVGVELARRIDAEIISLDSMALYRGMDIGTAKPTAEQRRAVPHHLIDVIDPSEEYSLARYIDESRRIAGDIVARGRQVLFVGGTPLYLKGLLRGIFEGPPADWEFRRRLADEARAKGDDWLHRRLREVDPLSAEKLHPNDARRIVRALEVFDKTGRPISELQRQFDVGRSAEECRVFALDWPREELYARIERRVDEMFAAGLVDEVREVLSVGSLSRTAGQAVGYREVIEHLEGSRRLLETIELVKRHTRQLAKRQMTWFRSMSECRFAEVPGGFNSAKLAEQIATLA